MKKSLFKWLKDEVLQETVRAVIKVGEVIKTANPEFKAKKGEGHRSGVTKGDQLAHEIIIERLSRKFPQAKFLSEEGDDEKNPRLFSKENPVGILGEPLAVIFDPLDGTASYGSQLGTWCVAAAIMRSGSIVGSVVYAPALNGGMITVAEKNNGLRIWEWNFEKETIIAPILKTKKLGDSFAAMGVDTTLYPSFMKIVPEIGRHIRAWGLANSGILGLTQVAAGRLQVIFEPPQKVWDWVPGYLTILESGNKIRFFRLIPEKDSKFSVLAPLTGYVTGYDCYDDKSFYLFPQENRLGYVAGQPEIVDYIFNLLPKDGWSRLNPDTV